ncbi:hypothetical protein L3X38_034760 [Prunus dulcis]|uniref:Uncharacterized protein n=1 Tax=Prunus dulcis TaxID=3755 RepID=A0AAD4YY16_PRUDU|nr:hypothetical protein L3X38_034760 [Prunus dulcis]
MWDLTIHPLKGSDVLVGTLAPHGRVALIPNCHTPDRLRRSRILVVTHPGIAPASNSLNFGVPTTPKPVSSQKASHYFDARCAI